MRGTITVLVLAAALAGAAGLALAQPETVTQVDALKVAVGEAPLPKVGRGAPNISPEQTASYICRNQEAGLWRIVTGPVMQRAHDATIRARQTRIDAFNGQADVKAMEKAELDRQEAVLRIYGSSKLPFTAPPPRNGLQLDPVTFARVNENGRWVLKIDGKIRNTTDRTIELPALSIHAVDVNDFMVAGQTNLLDKVELGPHEELAYTVRFHNPPAYGVRVVPMFAPPFYRRNFRGCDFFDPVDFDPNRSAVRRTPRGKDDPPPVAVPQVGEGAPRYTAAQIQALSREARDEAADAYNARLCHDAPGRRRWRELFTLADLIDEFWIATNAAEEIRRDAARGVFYPEEVASSELDRQKAVRAFMAARPASLPIAPMVQYETLALEDLAVSSSGEQTRIRGQVSNKAKDAAPIPPVRITLTDANGLVVAQAFRRIDDDDIRAGRSKSFSIELPIPLDLAKTLKVEFAC